MKNNRNELQPIFFIEQTEFQSNAKSSSEIPKNCQSVFVTMQFVKDIFNSFFSLDTYGDSELARDHFPSSMEEFGYHFNEKGELRQIENGNYTGLSRRQLVIWVSIAYSM
jgi:hypothetical protein